MGKGWLGSFWGLVGGVGATREMLWEGVVGSFWGWFEKVLGLGKEGLGETGHDFGGRVGEHFWWQMYPL